jgi:exopolysaccharide biosynthesis protein
MKLFLALFPLILIANPIVYEHIEKKDLSIHVLEVNPNEVTFELINLDQIEKPSVVGKSHEAIIATNGGFYHTDGTPWGILKINGELISKTDRERGAIGFYPFIIDRLDSDPESGSLFPLFHPENKEIWDSCSNILGGAPILLIDSHIPDFREESLRKAFIEERYARTAIGLKENGNLLLVMVEGPQSTKSEGMNLAELADFMLSRGCKDAINLSGGHSSALYYDGMVVHSGLMEEKPVGNVVIIKERLCQ